MWSSSRPALRRVLFAVPFLLPLLARPAISGPVPGPLVRVVAISPVDGARYVLPSTSILVRFDRAIGLDPGSLRGALAVSGSASGAHAGRTRVARDGTALVFEPLEPFRLGETVRVAVAPRAAPDAGRLGSARVFSFQVAAALGAGAALPSEFAGLGQGLSAGIAAPGQPRPGLVMGAGPAPPDFPQVTAQEWGATAPGYLFASNLFFAGSGTCFLMILDDTGAPVWFQPGGPRTDFKRQDNGQYSYYDVLAGSFTVLDSTMQPVDHWACGNGYSTDLHELRLLPDGHALLMSYDPETVDMSAVVPGGNPAATVIGLVIQEQDADKNVVFQWRSWDHFQVTDTENQDLTAATIDYVHGNALELDGDGNLLLSSRHMSEITKIDRQSGDVLWRWGGLHNEFAFVGDTLMFSFQHAVRRLENGHYTLFDNGDYHDPPFSRACEYVLDVVQHTATLVWSYCNEPDSYGFAMGYVQRLSNGNTLVSYGTGKPDAIEVAPDGTKQFELALPAGQSSYRTYRCPWNAQAVAAVEASSAPELAFLGPSPVHGSTVLLARLPRAGRVAVTLHDLQGRLVDEPLPPTWRAAGVLTVPVSLAGRPSGVYFCRLQAGQQSLVRRIVVTR